MELHQRNVKPDGTTIVYYSPYSRFHARYGYIDEDCYFKCKSGYCTEGSFGSLHKEKRDCVIDAISEWDEFSYKLC